MKVKRQTNFIWGLVALGVGLIVLLRALDVLPAGMYDLALRAWPALLVLFGLGTLLRNRIPLGNLIALIVSVALVGGLAASAYSSRATQERSDYQEVIAQPIDSGITLLRVSVNTLGTDVEIVRSLASGTVSGQFSGSSESLLVASYNELGDGTADLAVTESRTSTFPMLESIGRGRLLLELPAGVALDVSFVGQEGTVSLNMDGLALERLNMDLVKGNAAVSLPNYRPLGSAPDATLGALVVREGSVTLIVPTTVAARFTLNRGGSGLRPDFDSTVYNLLADGDGILEARNFDTSEIQIRYTVTVPRGLITVQAAGE
ncbi:MAG: hypothetical protein K8L97_05175 [Anaerolineae bacterium]|nr:hypothetical protein [Anaerolineae bacterium]